MSNLYDPKSLEECIARLETIGPDSLPLWGKMSVAQMMAHCSEVLDVYNGVKPLKTNIITRLFSVTIKQVVVGPEPYKKNSPTATQFKVTNHKDFKKEKERLLKALDLFHSMDKEIAQSLKHPLFGKMTLEEKGWAMYKHLDHHLEQFGV